MENYENTSNYEELRKEWANGLTRVMAKVSLGEVCYNCGSGEAIELHHIVPLKVGGTNNISNIAVLCHRCHMAIHFGQDVRRYQNKKNGGRPHKVDNERMEEAFELFLTGQIGRKQCIEMLNMSPASKLSDMSAYKRYIEQKGIKKVINKIDIITCIRSHAKRQKVLKDGQNVGTIIYIDGREDVLIYKNSNN